MNGHVGILRGDDVDRLPLKISAQTISVAQDYFPHTQSEDRLQVTNGGQQGSALRVGLWIFV